MLEIWIPYVHLLRSTIPPLRRIRNEFPPKFISLVICCVIAGAFECKSQEAIIEGSIMTDAVIVSYQLAEHLGVAFSERTVLESILGAEDLQTSGHLKDVLHLMRTLYVLSAADQAPVS
ncbi:unnamed protein product [Sphagnum troendelagicum]|uniref:Uncharacterized protein n=1 Tax=Sphagnum troendelagicum TaxID=128251 RepID=A0ABP0TQ79_9BRYO